MLDFYYSILDGLEDFPRHFYVWSIYCGYQKSDRMKESDNVFWSYINTGWLDMEYQYLRKNSNSWIAIQKIQKYY